MNFFVLITFALLPAVALLLLPAISDVTSLLRAARSLYRGSPAKSFNSLPQRFLFLVPAHNESLLVGRCVSSLLAMTRTLADFEVWVVADNCDDDTSNAAAAAGAHVLNRADPARPGKPRAIQWAFDQLALSGFDAVTIIDADTVVEPGFADALARIQHLRGQAVQPYNGIANTDDSWLTCLGTLLVKVRYEGQFLLKRLAGLNCPMSNGMTIGTDLLRQVGWHSESLTENWELYARWTAAGERIEYSPDACLLSQEAVSMRQSSTQRRRWQAGKWIVLGKYALPIARSSRIGWAQKIDALAELSAPGPALHAAMATLLALSLWFVPGIVARGLVVALAISVVPVIMWTTLALMREPNRLQILRAFAKLPVYCAWRLVIAFMAVTTARHGDWQRSPRQISDLVGDSSTRR